MTMDQTITAIMEFKNNNNRKMNLLGIKLSHKDQAYFRDSIKLTMI